MLYFFLSVAILFTVSKISLATHFSVNQDATYGLEIDRELSHFSVDRELAKPELVNLIH
jgi:hypothetical protein